MNSTQKYPVSHEQFSEGKYIRISEHNRKMQRARNDARWELGTLLIVVLIIPLIALITLLYIRSEARIDCGQLSDASINYLFDAGETLPEGCY